MKDQNDIQVKLKPFIGIRPGVYLTVIYSFVLLVILFFILLYPGLKNPGSVLIVKTDPHGAAVRINDVYMGLSGSKIFIPKGTHTIEAVMPGFESQSSVHQIGSRAFGSLFFPRYFRLEFTLKSNDPVKAFALYAADFADWTFAGEPSGSRQVPMSLSDGAYRLGPYMAESANELNKILRASSRFISTRAAIRDFTRAKVLLDNNGNAPSPFSILYSISDIWSFISENPHSADFLIDLLPAETSNLTTPFVRILYANEPDPFILPETYNITRGSDRRLNNLNFREFSLGHNFLISETPVSRALYETFLNENPQWKEHHTDYFPDELSIDLNRGLGNAITGITWYSAMAFCEWFKTRLPQPISGYTVRLPTEIEWTAAEHFIAVYSWEWCADLYAPNDFITASHEAIELIGSPERTLRTTNSADMTWIKSYEKRASLPPELSSPFVSFRIVIELP
ncbi:MAG: SUMF1/EgtB/PvdO family nonheme iron enzyme [Treponema sp.]|nr:SUMF1/EgtB/PvdO family nonheme iron enzyme [Treponema sp.]